MLSFEYDCTPLAALNHFSLFFLHSLYLYATGFLLLDKSQGFWVIHSIPEFPPFPQKGYRYPPSGQRNGQTAICLTFQYDQFAKIGNDMLPWESFLYRHKSSLWDSFYLFSLTTVWFQLIKQLKSQLVAWNSWKGHQGPLFDPSQFETNLILHAIFRHKANDKPLSQTG